MKSSRKALRIIGGAAEIEEPFFQASASEKATIKHFLDFALKDLKFQFERLRREQESPSTAINTWDLEATQAQAITIRKYVEALKSGLDAMEQVN